MKRVLFILFLLWACSAGCRVYYFYFPSSNPSYPEVSHARAAERLRSEGKYDAAIKEYQAHMQSRIDDRGRPGDENPYFYWILIGDVYLDQNRPDDALAAYRTARDNNVDSAMVLDRMRGLAKWYEGQKRYQEALRVLKEYRKFDDLMFDNDIDRIGKEIIRDEDAAEDAAKAKRK